MNHSIHLKLLLGAGAVFVVLAAFGLPVLGYLPILGLFAVCSMVMMFMMRGSDQGGDSNSDGDPADRSTNSHRH